MSIYTRKGKPPPPSLILAFMVLPFAAIDTFAMLALILGLADFVVHLLMMVLRHRSSGDWNG